MSPSRATWPRGSHSHNFWCSSDSTFANVLESCPSSNWQMIYEVWMLEQRPSTLQQLCMRVVQGIGSKKGETKHSVRDSNRKRWVQVPKIDRHEFH